MPAIYDLSVDDKTAKLIVLGITVTYGLINQNNTDVAISVVNIFFPD